MRNSQGDEAAVVVDPVCGTALLAGEGGVVVVEHHERTWRFCSERCRDRFLHIAERVRLDEAARRGALFAPGARVRWAQA